MNCNNRLLSFIIVWCHLGQV